MVQEAEELHLQEEQQMEQLTQVEVVVVLMHLVQQEHLLEQVVRVVQALLLYDISINR